MLLRVQAVVLLLISVMLLGAGDAGATPVCKRHDPRTGQCMIWVNTPAPTPPARRARTHRAAEVGVVGRPVSGTQPSRA